MGQKCEGNCGLWDPNEILKKTYPENLKKIVVAVWELQGQLISKTIYGVLDSPKKRTKTICLHIS